MTDKIALKLVGITYNQIESGVYAVILQEEEGPRRLPIIIGFPEAQAIECKLQEVKTPRPLTHDLMLSMMEKFRLSLREIWIYRLPNGMFAADMMIEGPRGELESIDSRSSDAISLAIRAGVPIYTSSELLDEVGYTAETQKEKEIEMAKKISSNKKSSVSIAKPSSSDIAKSDYASLPVSQLEKRMQKAVEEENYEEAGIIKRELDKRKKSNEE